MGNAECLTTVDAMIKSKFAAHAIWRESRFEEMGHPSYSSDLAPSDHHLSTNLKKHVLRQRNQWWAQWIEGLVGLFYRLWNSPR